MEEINKAATGLNWNSIVEFLNNHGIDSQTVVDFGKNLVIALLIFYIGRMVVGLVVRALRKVMQKQEVDKTLETFVCNLVRMALLVVVIIAAISALGIETTSFIAIFGAAGLAIGLALQNLQPSTLLYSKGRCGFAMNRRLLSERGFRNSPNPDGPVDHEVPVLQVAVGHEPMHMLVADHLRIMTRPLENRGDEVVDDVDQRGGRSDSVR